MNKSLKLIIIFLFTYLLSTGASYAVTKYLYTPEDDSTSAPRETPPTGGGLNIDPSAPKTAECPINGQMYTESERRVWETRRPLYIMIENSVDARPQSGLGSADVVYEAVAEGGITRFGGVFFCGVSAKDTIVGPVRSARIYFVNLASEYNYPLYTHVGGANCSPSDRDNPAKTCQTDPKVQALELLDKYGWVGSKGNDLNQFSIGFPTFWRDYERMGRTVATEHTMYSSTEKLWKYASEVRKWGSKSPDGKTEWKDNFQKWTWKDDVASTDRGSVNKIGFAFWDNYKDFYVDWSYDLATNMYKRDNGGTAHTDMNDKQQLDAKVVVVQYVKETGPVDILKHMYYEVIGSGQALVFQDGKVIEGSWKKATRESRTVFIDSKGKAISFNRGPIWIELVPTGNKVAY